MVDDTKTKTEHANLIDDEQLAKLQRIADVSGAPLKRVIADAIQNYLDVNYFVLSMPKSATAR